MFGLDNITGAEYKMTADRVRAFVTAVKDDNEIHSKIAQGYQIEAMLKKGK